MGSLREKGFTGRILLVTAGLPDADALRLIRMGISGIFHKQDSPEDLRRAVFEVAAGRVLIDQEYLQAVVAAGQVPEVPRFTERERSTMRLLLQGKANKEIAAEFGISESAVKATLQQLFSKTGVRTRSPAGASCHRKIPRRDLSDLPPSQITKSLSISSICRVK